VKWAGSSTGKAARRTRGLQSRICVCKDTGWSGKPRRLEQQISVLSALRENFDGGYLSDIWGLVRSTSLVLS